MVVAVEMSDTLDGIEIEDSEARRGICEIIVLYELTKE